MYMYMYDDGEYILLRVYGKFQNALTMLYAPCVLHTHFFSEWIFHGCVLF